VGVAPVLVGTAIAVASGGFRPVPALVALLGALLIQMGTNFSNDIFDFLKGADTPARIGPTRATAAGLLTPSQVRAGTITAFGAAVCAGAYLVSEGGLPILVIGVVSILSGLAYTGGPYPLGWNGLGDLFVFVFFGPVAVLGTVWVQMGTLPAIGWWASIPSGALGTAVLVVNNVRDFETDAVAGKRTLAVRFGRRFGVSEYAFLLGLAGGAPMALYAAGWVPSAWVLLPLATLPRGLRLLGVLSRSHDGRTLNEALAATARLGALHAALFATGLVARSL